MILKLLAVIVLPKYVRTYFTSMGEGLKAGEKNPRMAYGPVI